MGITKQNSNPDKLSLEAILALIASGTTTIATLIGNVEKLPFRKRTTARIEALEKAIIIQNEQINELLKHLD